MIKQSVLDEVRLFYRTGFNESGWLFDEESYSRSVLSRSPKDKFKAALLWLIEAEAITSAQGDRLDAIYVHRHDLTHELIKYVVDPDFEPDVDLFTDALSILTAIRRFWTSIEMEVGTFEDHGAPKIDDITPLSLLVLHQCIEAYEAGLAD